MSAMRQLPHVRHGRPRRGSRSAGPEPAGHARSRKRRSEPRRIGRFRLDFAACGPFTWRKPPGNDRVFSLCVVEVEVTVRRRPSRVVASAPRTRPSWIACVKSSRTPPLPASVAVGQSGRPPAAVPDAMSPGFPQPHTAIHAPRPGTSKKPLKRLLCTLSQSLPRVPVFRRSRGSV